MLITALAENTSAREEIGCEHGLSLYIRWQGRTILFDMGQGDLFARNAAALGLELRQVDWAVLSHGHYDHGGGLARFLQENDTAPVYVNPFAFQPHYNARGKEIGLDPALASHPRLVFPQGDCPLCEGAWLLRPRRQRRRPLDSAGLTAEVDGVLQPEDFRHEQYLLLEEDGKRVLFSGCSHNGAAEIVDWFRPDVLVGGFHLMRRPLDRALVDTARDLERLGAAYLTCHCTGEAQYGFLRPYLSRLRYLSAGMTAEV